MQRKELEGLSREELIAKAETAGVVRPRTLTIPELIDEILRASSKKPGDKKARGWFGRARDLLTSVVDRGLNQPAPRTRDGRAAPPAGPPLPTVTLAEIYAAQGHLERAIATLDEVIAKDPTHSDAKVLRDRFEAQIHKTKPSTPPPVVEAKLEPMPLSSTKADGEKVGATAEASSPADTAAPPARTIGSTPPPGPRTSPPAAAPSLDVDEIVALSSDPHTVYLYWEVRPSTLASARATNPHGALIIRAVTVRPSEVGVPSTDVRDFRVDTLFGELFVHGLPAQANVRVSVGYKSTAGFEPFAVGMDLMTPREAPAPEEVQTFRRWSDAGRGPGAPAFDDPIQRALAAQRQRAFHDPGDEPESLVARFPAGVWIDPSHRVVQVVGASIESIDPPEGAAPAGEETTVSRPPGSSELVRRQVVWASKAVLRP